MVNANETLGITVKATDQTKAALGSVQANLDSVAAKARNAGGAVAESSKKSSEELAKMARRQKVVNDLFGEFGSKVKVFLAADVLARMFGFTSLMDALNKGVQGVSDGLNSMILGLTGIDLTKIRLFKSEASDLKVLLGEINAAIAAAKGEVGVLGDVFPVSSIPDINERRAVAEALFEAAREFEAFKTKNAPVRGTGRQADAGGGVLPVDSPAEQERKLALIEEKRIAIVTRLRETYEFLHRQYIQTRQAIAEGEEFDAERDRLTAQRNVERAQQNAAGAAILARFREREAKATALAAFANSKYVGGVIALNVAVAAHVIAAKEAADANGRAGERLKAWNAYQEEAAARHQESARKLGVVNVAALGQLGILLQIPAALAKIKEQQDKLADSDFSGGFKEGAANAAKFFGTLREEGARLGEQAVFAGFDALRGFFNDVITGSVKGGEAFKRFAQSLVASAAQILSQMLALRTLGFFLPGLGILGAASRAQGGVETGGIQSFAMGGVPSGGMVTGPRLLAVGDNPERSEAILPLRRGPSGRLGVEAAGGGGATINLTVNSLDPRTAADVVLAQMPKIQRALATAMSKGTSRALIQATQGSQF